MQSAARLVRSAVWYSVNHKGGVYKVAADAYAKVLSAGPKLGVC
jgi:hypothetical protein